MSITTALRMQEQHRKTPPHSHTLTEQKTQPLPKPPKPPKRMLSVYRETEAHRQLATKPRPRKWQKRQKFFSLARRHMPSTSALRRQRTDFCEFEARVVYSVSLRTARATH